MTRAIRSVTWLAAPFTTTLNVAVDCAPDAVVAVQLTTVVPAGRNAGSSENTTDVTAVEANRPDRAPSWSGLHFSYGVMFAQIANAVSDQLPGSVKARSVATALQRSEPAG